ncbi:hypothetical protein [Streptomyces guryensis]|uniref:Uncharacterized protein n=1 Tax=Streptomyces guryensis TaxID=2886947 RepID=A0A9Q3ZAK0_9ACTN|nr:hypothetical protein [Streptomyces guryensis]MCD9875430.1 hypothetical protein [Streptomyces guryensis]
MTEVGELLDGLGQCLLQCLDAGRRPACGPGLPLRLIEVITVSVVGDEGA